MRSPSSIGPGIGHGPQPVVAHFEDADLAGRPEPVLDRREDPQGVMAVAVEGEHGVDEMLDRPGSGQVAVLGDVADQDHGHPGGLGQPGQPVDARPDLGQASGGPGQRVVGDGLDRVDHDQGRMVAHDGRLDGDHVVPGQGQEVSRARPRSGWPGR